MRILNLSLFAAALHRAAAIGFSTYALISEGTGVDNSDTVAYSQPDRSNTLFLYIQIVAGEDHSKIIGEFQTLCQNYGSHGVSVIPRVRYGKADTSVASEPDKIILMQDAGFLGQWGEWHDGQYCGARGAADSESNLSIKKQVVETLLQSGHKIALRYPQDHSALYGYNRTVTIHDDCIFDGGLNGYDGGTFPSDDRETWVNYTKTVTGNNTFGGEGCDDASDATYDWSNWPSLCGEDGLVAYINELQIAYLNPSNPKNLQNLFYNTSESSCVGSIQAALEQYS